MTINLAGPICQCDKQNLSWGISQTKDNTRGVILSDLHISCKTCGTRLAIPHDKFFAFIKCEKQYPNGFIEPKKLKEVEKPEDEKIRMDKFFETYEKQMRENS